MSTTCARQFVQRMWGNELCGSCTGTVRARETPNREVRQCFYAKATSFTISSLRFFYLFDEKHKKNSRVCANFSKRNWCVEIIAMNFGSSIWKISWFGIGDSPKPLPKLLFKKKQHFACQIVEKSIVALSLWNEACEVKPSRPRYHIVQTRDCVTSITNSKSVSQECFETILVLFKCRFQV